MPYKKRFAQKNASLPKTKEETYIKWFMPTGHDYCEFDNTTKKLYNMETLKESSLNVILESFKGVREISDEHLKMEKLQNQFCPL